MMSSIDAMTVLIGLAGLAICVLGFIVGWMLRGEGNEHYYLQRARVQERNRQAAAAVPEVMPAGGFGGIFTADEREAS